MCHNESIAFSEMVRKNDMKNWHLNCERRANIYFEGKTFGNKIKLPLERYLPTIFKRNAIDILGSVFTWHSYIPESRACENFICSVQFSKSSDRITWKHTHNRKHQVKITHIHPHIRSFKSSNKKTRKRKSASYKMKTSGPNRAKQIYTIFDGFFAIEFCGLASDH